MCYCKLTLKKSFYIPKNSKPEGISFRYFKFETIIRYEDKVTNNFILLGYKEELSMMNKLQQYFPMIRTKEEVLREIENNSKLKEIYENWQEDERE